MGNHQWFLIKLETKVNNFIHRFKSLFLSFFLILNLYSNPEQVKNCLRSDNK